MSDLSFGQGTDQVTDSGTATETQTEENGQGPDQSGYSGFISDVLNGVPPEHVKLLEPYIKKFDAGVTRRFQDLSTKYKPYEDLGADPETLANAYKVYQMLDENPQQIYELLRQDFEDADDEDEEQNLAPVAPGNIPPEWESRFTKQQEILEALVQHVMSDRETKQQAQEDQELDQYMSLLKTEYGDFDEDYVLAKMSAGADGEAAVKSWMTLQQKIINGTAKVPTTPVLSGGGSVPGESQSIKDLKPNQVKDFVANLLSQTSREGQ